MKTSEDIDRLIDKLRRRAGQLERQASQGPERGHKLRAAFEELRAALKELRVADEELHRENEQLRKRAEVAQEELLAREQAARLEAKKAEQRLGLLAEASARLTSLDPASIIARLARLAVPEMADLCVVYLPSEEKRIRRVEIVARDAAKEELLRRLERRYPIDWEESVPVAEVIRTGEALLEREVTDAGLERIARSAEHFGLLRGLALRSVIVVPLNARGQTLGAVTFATVESGRLYTAEDLSFAQELARRAALALDNARLYQDEQQSRQAAERANQRIAHLQSTTAAVSRALSPIEVVSVAIRESIYGEEASAGGVALLSEDETELKMVAFSGVDDTQMEKYARIPIDAPVPMADAVRKRESLWFRTPEEVEASYPSVYQDHVANGYVGFAVLPLVYEGRALGVLSLSFAQPREFRDDEREFLHAIARQCALALDRAQVYESQRTAREAAELASQRVSRLQQITAALAEAVTPQDVAQVIVNQGLRGLGARSGSTAILVGDDTLEMIGTIGYAEEVLESWERFPLSSPVLIAEVTRRGEPILVESRQMFAERYPHLRPILPGSESCAALPLVSEGRVIGGMVLGFDESTDFTEQDLEFLLAIARQCAQALERSRLYSGEQQARAAAERAQRRLAFLAEASAVLGSSLDYETTLMNVAKLAVPQFADWCVADVLEEGSLSRLGLAYSDPAKLELVREIRERYPQGLDIERVIQRVLRSGEPAFYSEIADAALANFARDEEHLRLLRALSVESGMIVPLKAHNQILGAITFISAESGRRYTEEDLVLAQDLARRAGLAIENARLYRGSQRIQEELRKANESKDEFLGMISHEMRTSITTIYGGASILRTRGDQLDDKSKTEVLADIQEDADHLQHIIADMFTLARVELGQKMTTEPIAVHRVIEKVAGRFQETRPYRPVLVEVEDDLPPAEAEQTYLEQVLRNLLSNADKYSPSTSPIEVHAKRNGENEVMVSVLDRGRGISPEETDRIFERFYRSSQSPNDGGTGIGLTVCKRLIEAQSGRIWAQPREGGGLEVSFTLPLYPGAIAS